MTIKLWYHISILKWVRKLISKLNGHNIDMTCACLLICEVTGWNSCFLYSLKIWKHLVGLWYFKLLNFWRILVTDKALSHEMINLVKIKKSTISNIYQRKSQKYDSLWVRLLLAAPFDKIILSLLSCQLLREVISNLPHQENVILPYFY